jgi:LysR family nitrogen assimilation transcriptional regulator
VNFRQLKYFVGVVDAGNMTRAAEQLHVAQTALGMQIRQIEDDLGVPLLVRHSRGIETTKAGRLLYDRAVEILKRIEDTRREVMGLDEESTESIRLGITPALMAAIGPDIALGAKQRMPRASLSMAEAMSHVLTGMLDRGEVDYILGYDIPDEPQFLRSALMQDDLFLVTKPLTQRKPTVDFIEAIGNDLAMPESGDTVRNVVMRAAKDLGHELRIAYEVRSVSAMKSLVLRGVAVSILPLFSVIDELRGGLLEARRITSPSVHRTLYLASSRQRGTFRNSGALTATIQDSLQAMIERIGPLAPQSWARIL